MDATHWGYWLAGDRKRFSRKHFIGIHVKGASIKPSFTVENFDMVFSLIKDLIRDSRKNESAMKKEEEEEEKNETVEMLKMN